MKIYTSCYCDTGIICLFSFCLPIYGTKKDQSNIKFLDFTFIESFTNDNHISYHSIEKRPDFYLATPRMVYDDKEEVTLETLLTNLKGTPESQSDVGGVWDQLWTTLNSGDIRPKKKLPDSI